MKDWQKEMLWLSVVYRLAQCNEQVPINTDDTHFEFIDSELSEMHSKSLLKISDNKQNWILDTKGKELLTRIEGMFDQFLHFEIFAEVNHAKEIPSEIMDDEEEILNHCHDPRFDNGGHDMRIAMMGYVGKRLEDAGKNGSLDPMRIVFLQQLGQGKFSEDAKDFWFNLLSGEIFADTEEIVSSAYKWSDLGEDDEESINVCESMYAAGMIEQRKRDGDKCSGCNIPLAIFEAEAKENEEELNECPNPDCEVSFGEDQGDYECPSCKSSINDGQSVCTGCGANINFSLPQGTVQQETEMVTTAEHCDYGYTPYGWYDPWDPVVDAMAFGLVCGVIL